MRFWYVCICSNGIISSFVRINFHSNVAPWLPIHWGRVLELFLDPKSHLRRHCYIFSLPLEFLLLLESINLAAPLFLLIESVLFVFFALSAFVVAFDPVLCPLRLLLRFIALFFFVFDVFVVFFVSYSSCFSTSLQAWTRGKYLVSQTCTPSRSISPQVSDTPFMHCESYVYISRFRIAYVS